MTTNQTPITKPTKEELRRVYYYLKTKPDASPKTMRDDLEMVTPRIWACIETLQQMTAEETERL